MINRILDNYYFKKLVNCMELWALPYGIVVLSIKNDSNNEIYIKDRRFSDSHYQKVLTIKKEDAVLCLCNLIKAKEEFVTKIKVYKRGEAI